MVTRKECYFVGILVVRRDYLEFRLSSGNIISENGTFLLVFLSLAAQTYVTLIIKVYTRCVIDHIIGNKMIHNNGFPTRKKRFASKDFSAPDKQNSITSSAKHNWNAQGDLTEIYGKRLCPSQLFCSPLRTRSPNTLQHDGNII